MPKKKSQLRIAYSDVWDILHILDYELIAHEGFFYLAKRTIIYTPMDPVAPKIKIL